MAEKEKFIVTYEDPDHIWPAFYEEYKHRLPIGPILPPSGPASSGSSGVNGSPLLASYTSLPRVDFEFHPFPAASSKDVLSMHRLPFMNLFLTVVEDVDMYKAKVRPRIVHWVENVQARKHQQCIIVLVSTGPGSTAVPKATTMFAQKPLTLKDRVATDFKSTNARTVQIRLGSQWADFHDAINECFYTGFGHLVFQLEDDIRRLEAQRQLPGWNFCIFFVTKEALALLLMMVGLHEDALKQYDQLEATFTEVISSDSEAIPDRSSFPDTKRSIQSYREAGIREKIYQNNCSLCDFSCYLFAQQIYLLAAVGRISEILSRGRKFISQYCYSDCQQEGFSWDLRAKWSYQVAMDLISSSKEYADGLVLSPLGEEQGSFDFHLAELFLLARRHLDHFASTALPAFGRKNSLSILPDTAVTSIESNLDHANSIDEVISDPETFERVYRHLTQKMTEVFSTQRLERKETMALYDYALIHLMYGRYQDALEVLLKLSKRKTDWTDIEFGIGKALVKCHKGLKQDEQYLQACTDLVNKYSRLRPKATSKIIQDIVSCEVASALEPIPIGPQVFAVNLLPTSTTNELCLELENPFSSFPVDEFGAQLLLGSAEILFISENCHELSAGKNLLRLKCDEVLEENVYLLSNFSFRLPSNLVLQTNLLLGQISSKHKISLKNDSNLEASASMTEKPEASGLVITLESKIALEGLISLGLGGLSLDPACITVDSDKIDFEIGEDTVKLEIRDLKKGTSTIFINDPNLGDSAESLKFNFSFKSSTLKFSKWLEVDRTQFATIKQTATVKNNRVYRALQVTPRVSAQLEYYILLDLDGNCTKVERTMSECQSTFYITIKHKVEEQMKRVILCFRDIGSEVFASAQLLPPDESSLYAELESYSLRRQMAYKMSLNLKTTSIGSALKYALNCVDNDDWVIIGKTAGFIDSSSGPLTVQIIPLRCGNLPLPWISVESPLVSIPSNGAFVSVAK